MKLIVIVLCLIGAVLTFPISIDDVTESEDADATTTEHLVTSQSSEKNSSEPQSSEENISNQASSSESLSSESDSAETTSEDTTSEESDSQSDEVEVENMSETKDNSMSSEENMRKSWIPVFPSVIRVLSAEDDTSTEVKGLPDHLNTALSEKPRTGTPSFPTKSSTSATSSKVGADSSSSSSSESADISDTNAVRAARNDSSSESVSSEDTGDSEDSDSEEQNMLRATECRPGADSAECDSDEDFFKAIGDDSQHPVDHLMVPEMVHRELNLRR